MLPKALKLASRIAVAGIALGWLVHSGRLDPTKLAVYSEHPETFALLIFAWVSASLVIGAMRWRTLCQALGVNATLRQAIRLQAVGQFFNTALPGSVSGDAVKAVQLSQEAGQSNPVRALAATGIERLVGLSTFILISAVASLFNTDAISSKTAAINMTVRGIGLGLILIGALAKPLGGKFLRRFASAIDTVHELPHRGRVLATVVIQSLVMQFLYLFLYWRISALLCPGPLNLPVFLSILPLGLLLAAVPIAPAGLGVGHVAFDQLYSLAGFGAGADVYNAVVIGQIVMNLLGAIPFIMPRSVGLGAARRRRA